MLSFSLIPKIHNRVTLTKHFVTFSSVCIMLTAFFIACPFGIAALFGFAKLINPQTGRIGSR